MSTVSDLSKNYQDDQLNFDHEFNCAKSYLQKRCPYSNDSLYDLISELLSKILADRPRNPVAVFEKYVQQIRNEYFAHERDYFQDIYLKEEALENAKKIISYFKVDKEKSAEDSVTTNLEQLQDLPKLFYNFQQVGVTLSQSEILLLDYSIRELVKKVPIENVRFWGKMFGTVHNYFIVEANLQDQELERRLEELDRKEGSELEGEEIVVVSENIVKEKTEFAYNSSISDIAGNIKTDAIAERIVKRVNASKMNDAINKIPPERLGTGANANVYFACNFPGLDNWIELPLVTPQQIIISRQIACFFTGKLDNEMNTYPPFPGKEINYLRAQIARISATTLISPIGYFKFSENEDDKELEEEDQNEDDMDIFLEENDDYNPPPIKDLIDPMMTNWCHHSPYLHKQGRVIFWDPKELYDNEIEVDEGDEMFQKKDDGVDKRTTWSRLLAPLSKDIPINGVLPWSTRQFSKTRPETSVVLVRSNIWPGAFTYAAERHFGNIYIGWGLKLSMYHYVPLEPSQLITDNVQSDTESDNVEYEEEAESFVNVLSGVSVF